MLEYVPVPDPTYPGVALSPQPLARGHKRKLLLFVLWIQDLQDMENQGVALSREQMGYVYTRKLR